MLSNYSYSLAGVFGMFEIEKAAEVILKKQLGRVPPARLSPVYLEDFETEDERKGFVELIYGGFLSKQDFDIADNLYTYNGGFVPGEKFYARLQSVPGGVKPDKHAALQLRKADSEEQGGFLCQ